MMKERERERERARERGVVYIPGSSCWVVDQDRKEEQMHKPCL